MDFTNEQNDYELEQSTAESIMNSGNQQPTDPPIFRDEPEINRFTTSALTLGTLALISAIFCTVYFPFIFGGLSIILALLSKGSFPTMHKKAKNGIILSIVALVINIVIISSSLFLVFSSDEYREQLNIMSEQIYGQSFDETLDQMINGTYDN